MQVFGLPRHLTRTAQSASRLLGAKPPNSEAERRRDAVARWSRARREGLTADQAARAVGVSRATLYRWQIEAEPKSRRPHAVRKPAWSPLLPGPSRICAPTIPCTENARSRRCSGERASDPRSRPSAASCASSWTAALSRLSRPYAATRPPAASGSPRVSATPAACRKASSRLGPASSSRSTPCS